MLLVPYLQYRVLPLVCKFHFMFAGQFAICWVIIFYVWLLPIVVIFVLTVYILYIQIQYNNKTIIINNNNRKNAWDNSGARDALANAQQNLPQGTQDTLTLAKTKIFNRQNLRSPTIFFGIGEEQPFYIEKVPSLITERIKHNVSFFYLNYCGVVAVLFCLTLLISPSAIIGMGLLGFAWVGLLRATSEGSMEVKGE